MIYASGLCLQYFCPTGILSPHSKERVIYSKEKFMLQENRNKIRKNASHQTDEVQFVACLAQAAADRGAWAHEKGISCYRLYDADVPSFAFAIDRYEGVDDFEGESYLVVSQYRSAGVLDEQEEIQRLEEAVEISSRELSVPCSHIFKKTRHHDRSGSQYKDGERDSYFIHTQESGYKLEVDLQGHLDTGIFLDHRPVREMIGQMAKGARFLNLFAYTGTATVHAAGAGAATTTTVDLSQTYLNWAKRNMVLNELEGSHHRFIRSDAMHWLDRDIKKGAAYELVFVDPPTFSRSKLKGKKTWNVERDYFELLKKVAAVLSPGGKAIFSCNLRDFKPDFSALKQCGIELTDITAQTIPQDFSQNPKIHSCFFVASEKDK